MMIYDHWAGYHIWQKDTKNSSIWRAGSILKLYPKSVDQKIQTPNKVFQS